ncbi:MAG TPA: hypothetical protein VGK38_05690 [Prolixibacteraceae bacterium]|jgi:hypothetical protein
MRLVRTGKITWTVEMENSPFGVRPELLEFEKLTDNTGKLNMYVIYEPVEHGDKVLKIEMQ